jgi:hypothetical protein
MVTLQSRNPHQTVASFSTQIRDEGRAVREHPACGQAVSATRRSVCVTRRSCQKRVRARPGGGAGGARPAVLRPATDIFRSLADKDNPRAAGGSADRRSPWPRSPAQHLAGGPGQPAGPQQHGTVMRTIDAVGASGLILLEGGADPAPQRASLGPCSDARGQRHLPELAAWFRRRASGDGGRLRWITAPPLIRAPPLLMGSEREADAGPESIGCDGAPAMTGRVTSLAWPPASCCMPCWRRRSRATSQLIRATAHEWARPGRESPSLRVIRGIRGPGWLMKTPA